MGLDMMYSTCTIQVNLDFASEEDMVKKLRVALALQPVATAFFANSPFYAGHESDNLSMRGTDLEGCGPRPDRNAPIRIRRRIRIRGLGRVRFGCSDVFRLPRRKIRGRARPVVQGFHGRAFAIPAGRAASGIGLGRSPHDDFSRKRGSSSSWRCAAPTGVLGASSALFRRFGWGFCTSRTRLMPLGTW